MILILSNTYDTSTTLVIEWIESIGYDWIRVNEEDKYNIEFLFNDIKFTNKVGDSFFLSDIKAFWYRRGFFKIKNITLSEFSEFERLQREEVNKIMEFIFYKLSTLDVSINSALNFDVNKLIVLEEAQKVGLQVPKEFIVSNESGFRDILKMYPNKKFITKTISGDSIYNFNDFLLFNYSKTINNVDSKEFFPSLIQEYIEKRYELRIFYLDEKFYSMAIFSQNDEQTKIDFRRYNKTKPNRTVPFLLPQHIEKKLISLLKKIDLNCGSIDMIVNKNLEFIFLEVNPVGQFGMVSYPCNYNLEYEIAKKLTSYE